MNVASTEFRHCFAIFFHDEFKQKVWLEGASEYGDDKNTKMKENIAKHCFHAICGHFLKV